MFHGQVVRTWSGKSFVHVAPGSVPFSLRGNDADPRELFGRLSDLPVWYGVWGQTLFILDATWTSRW